MHTHGVMCSGISKAPPHDVELVDPAVFAEPRVGRLVLVVVASDNMKAPSIRRFSW